MEALKKIEGPKEICTKAFDQVSWTWEALMEYEQSQKIASELTAFEVNIAQIRNGMKKLLLAQKMAKKTKTRKLQQQMALLRTQQQHSEEKVEELQAKAEIIKKVHDIATPIKKVMPEHVSSDLVEQLKKTEE